jgi:hypothetical protein
MGCGNNPLYEIPAVDHPTKPWTRWWWMGNSVTRSGITQHLEAFKEVGLGGVEIIPIYGEKGDEENFIPYMSDQWIAMLLYTLREAQRLDLEVDMTLGSGWPYGGPWITEEFAAKRYSVLFNDGEPTGQMVKRAAPGAHGFVVDHFSPEAMQRFLVRFDSLITVVKNEDLPLRAIFNDSYEVYGADWTNNFREKFLEQRGYVFPDTLINSGDTNDVNHIREWQDYHHTINDLVYKTVGETISEWCNEYQLKYRYQSHGSPSNLLDLYALASIPETECFGSSAFRIPLVDYDNDYDESRFGRPHPLIYKFASSPAHIFGKPLVSSETATWLAEHFKTSLAQIKPQVDELFTSGINHILYHGISYSPFEKDFPGRLFYASTNMGPNSALWPYLDELNSYITNCQSILQHTNPDNDILLYYPVHDLWTNKRNDGNLIMQSVHNPQTWFFNTEFGKTAQRLYDNGFTFDYISDKQISDLVEVSATSSIPYKVIIIPPCQYMPVETARQLHALHKVGLKILFLNNYPNDVPGIFQYGERSNQLGKVLHHTNFGDSIPEDILSVSNTLAKYNVLPESMKNEGLTFIRKEHKNGYIYFIANLTGGHFRDFLSISRDFITAELYDPMTGQRGQAQIQNETVNKQIRLNLNPGASIFLITYNSEVKQSPWQYLKFTRQAINLVRNWRISINNRLEDYAMYPLYCWTHMPFDWAPYYSGPALYKTTFDLDLEDTDTDVVIIDLGDLRYMATAWLNDKKVGDFWCVPYQAVIPKTYFKSSGNKLVIEVRNLDANRVRQLDRNKVPWKNFYDINFVSIRYEPFDAARWEPMPSGLLGPVRLIPCRFD